LIGIASKRKKLTSELALAFLGLFICHLLGVLWFAYVSGISASKAFLLSSLPYIIKDILSLIFARFLFLKIRKRAANFAFFKNSK
jgi:biotin transport system substrate-specific component